MLGTECGVSSVLGTECLEYVWYLSEDLHGVAQERNSGIDGSVGGQHPGVVLSLKHTVHLDMTSLKQYKAYSNMAWTCVA